MVCDTTYQEGQTKAQRDREIKEALARLEEALKAQQVTMVIDKRTGSVAFNGWKDKERSGVNDACAYRKLAASNSWALRQAKARAEVLAGRSVNEQAVNAGTHSHDGGKTWHKGH